MVPEAPLEPTETGLVQSGPGWFVVNARESRWRVAEGRGSFTPFGDEAEFPQLGFNLFVLGPGDAMGMYHWEADQEDFLVLSGEALLIVEGEERRLQQWDLVHCPPETKHIIVGAGDGPCVVLAVGAREHQDGAGLGRLHRGRGRAPPRCGRRRGDDRPLCGVRQGPAARGNAVPRELASRVSRRTLSGMSDFPEVRLRRFRRNPTLRALVRETRLSLDQFVMPLFVAPESLRNEQLPGMARHSLEDVVSEVEELVRLGVQAVILFGIPEEKDEQGTGAWEDDGIVQRALRALRPRFPELVLMSDVCLCEYTSHGHCGVIVDGEVHNDQSLELIVRTAVSHVEAGADVVAPSDMMDGRVGAIREALDDRSFETTPILAYSAKYASAFYGPFREAADSTPAFGDRRGYQMDPANVREALREAELDIDEGADAIMIKPALPYLDVIRAARESFDVPIGAYNVSGEYAMVKAAAQAGWLDERQAALESLTAIKRAGADLIISYWTKDLAQWL